MLGWQCLIRLIYDLQYHILEPVYSCYFHLIVLCICLTSIVTTLTFLNLSQNINFFMTLES